LGPCESNCFPSLASLSTPWKRPYGRNTKRTPPVPLLSDVNLDEFEICVYKLWSLGVLIHNSGATWFATPPPSSPYGYPPSGVLIYVTPGISSPLGTLLDVLVFSIIVATIKRLRVSRYPGVPALLFFHHSGPARNASSLFPWPRSDFWANDTDIDLCDIG
jgi:hypothetical protein